MTKTQAIDEIKTDLTAKLTMTHEDIEQIIKETGCGCPLCGKGTDGPWWIELSEIGPQIICQACASHRSEEYGEEVTHIRVESREQRADREDMARRDIGIN